MTHTIIGIHGLANKPERATLEKWWHEAIKEGLRKNENYREENYEFELVYWADLLYKSPLHEDVHFDFDNLFNTEPYLKAHKDALKEYHESFLDDVRVGSIDAIGGLFDLIGKSDTVSNVPEFVLKKFLKDLALYYTKERKILNRQKKLESARKVLQDELATAIKKSRATKSTTLIAHSMGSIIAYDVMRDIGRENLGINIDHFITIGSPLGLSHVKKNIELDRKEYSDVPLRSPTIIAKSWINYADKKDPVAIDTSLSNVFGQNERGVKVEDDLVANDYSGRNDERNHHKSYGYLRTPEISRQIHKILEK